MAKNEVETYFERHRRRMADWKKRIANNPIEAAFWEKVKARKARLKAERERRRKEIELRTYKADLADKLAFPPGLFAYCQSIAEVDEVAKDVCKNVLNTTPKQRMQLVEQARQQYDQWRAEVRQAKPPGADWSVDYLNESAKFEEVLELPKLRALLKPPPKEPVSFADLYNYREEEGNKGETDTSA